MKQTETKTLVQKAYVIDVNMGYGHSRAAYALKDLGAGQVICANNYHGIPKEDRNLWRETCKLYETVSRLKNIPVFGPVVFDAMDHFQQIEHFYPRRDLSKPNLQVCQNYLFIKRGLGKHLIERLALSPLPIVATFFTIAQAADFYNYPEEIYCVTTDADISRSWAPMDPKKSRIKYFASNGRVVERLKLYGVREDHIYLTGFPLPKECIGGASAHILKEDLMQRICHLDPRGIFIEHYKKTIAAEIGGIYCKKRTALRPLTILYTVGGAGAQKSLGVEIIKSLSKRILRCEVRLILMAGVRREVARYFTESATRLGLKRMIGNGIMIPFYKERAEYFAGFNQWLSQTDILWTKPSELSFYCGLGLPIIMSPPIGSQEKFNQIWLQYLGAGVPQNDPRYTDEWLFDWIFSGGIARHAWNGYIEAPTHGTYRIEDHMLGRTTISHALPLIV